MFLVYNTNSGSDVYSICNHDTNRIHNMRGIILLKIMFYQDKLITGMITYMTQFDDSDIDEILVG